MSERGRRKEEEDAAHDGQDHFVPSHIAQAEPYGPYDQETASEASWPELTKSGVDGRECRDGRGGEKSIDRVEVVERDEDGLGRARRNWGRVTH